MTTTPRPSRAHWRVQTRTSSGWVTRCWSADGRGAILAAEGYADDLKVAARVVLGDVVYYETDAGARARTA